MTKSLLKSALREIKSSFGRYIAIMAIVALGVGFMSGLMVSEETMVSSANDYLEKQGYYDFRLISTMGFDDDDVAALAKEDHVTKAAGAYRLDAFAKDGGDSEFVGRFLSIADGVNEPLVKSGRMPKNANECLADNAYYDEDDIGKTITITKDNTKDTLDALKEHEMTIVGVCDSPLNMRLGRIATDIGSGEVKSVFYVPEDNYTSEYYSEVYLLSDAEGVMYSDTYDDAIDAQEDAIEDATLALATAHYDDVMEEIEDGRKEATAALKKANDAIKMGEAAGATDEMLKEAREGAKKAQAALDDLDEKTPDEPDVYVMTRNEDMGYQFFKNDSSIISGVAKVFPIFFFLVAALVCITTMTRMMNEQRTQIGVLKSMGYSSTAILGKYLIYSGSSGILGALLGFFAGTIGLPAVFWSAYSTYYAFPEKLPYLFDVPLFVTAIVVAIFCTMGVTWICGRNDLAKTAANLIRPKAPKAGKRNLLERITPFWSRLSFLQKITVRNLFRYKGRFFMMVLGIGGCTALIVAALGLQANFVGVGDIQYTTIDVYDATESFSDAPSEKERTAQAEKFKEDIDASLYSTRLTMDISANNVTHSVSVNAPEAGDYSAFFDWHDGDETLSFPKKDEILLDRGTADRLGVEAGDTITLYDTSMYEKTLTVSGVFDNYISNNVYISRDTLKEGFDKGEINFAYIDFADGVNKSEVAAKMMENEKVTNVSLSEDSMDMFSDMLDSLDLIIFVIICCAGALAFIVLYNLTNINISERIREIATLKVLGFYTKETNAYVFRENTILTMIGALFGLGLGKALHYFVMTQINVDGLRFDIVIAPDKYLIAFVLTMVFAVITQFIMKKKISKIHMAESLKSVE